MGAYAIKVLAARCAFYLFIRTRSYLIFLARGRQYPAMIWLVLRTLISAFRTHGALALENLALRQQLAILQRSVKRPRLSDLDRGFWVLLRGIWMDWDNVLVIVKSETVVRWHRSGFRRYWTWKSRKRRPGRPGVALEVRELIREEVAKVNYFLPEGSKVDRFFNLPKELDPDEDELTRSRKIRRSFLEQKYADFIAATYEGRDQFDANVPIKYQDGRVGTLNATIFIVDLESNGRGKASQ